MKAVGVLAIAGVGLLVGGAAVIALRDDEPDGSDILDLPGPNECTSAEEVWEATQAAMAETGVTADQLRDIATTFDTWGEYCDDEARTMAKTCSALLRARADLLAAQPPPTPGLPPPVPPPVTPGVNLPPSPIQLPGGHYYPGYGWCLPGAVLDLSTGLCDVTNPVVIQTSGSGSCCASCEHSGECEGCG